MPNVQAPTEQSNADSLALFSAVEEGDAARVASLLSVGARADANLRGGETPLMRAAARGHEDVARVLLDAGADVNARRADGFTPLVLAVFFGHEEVVRLLIERGADVSAQTRLGTTAENWAASRGFAQIAGLLRSVEAVRPRANKKVSDASEARASAGNATEAKAIKAVAAANVAADDAKVSKEAMTTVAVVEAVSVSVRHDGREPAHPSSGAFHLSGFMRSWQASVGLVLLLTAVGVAVFAIWNKSSAQTQQNAQALQTPMPQMPTPDASVTVTQASPLPSPTPDVMSVQPTPAVPPGAIYPAPNASAQPFYVPPAATNAPFVPTVISESGEPAKEDVPRPRRKPDATTNDSTNRPSEADNRDDARADDGSRTGTSGRSVRTPVSEPQPTPPVRTSPALAPTPERGKVIQWPPQ